VYNIHLGDNNNFPEADHYNRHGKYDALKEAELEKRVRSEYESWLGKMYNYGTGGGCGK